MTSRAAMCRVTITLRPSRDSDIKVEVWLPHQWNGRFLGTGNGGLGGVIDYAALADGVSRRFAVANTDLGTSVGEVGMAGHMERVIDFGYRATHEMTVASKLIVAAYYGTAPSYAYFRGCSTGGGQGMHEVQQFPADYDGLLVGAPGAARLAGHFNYLWAYAATQADADSALTLEKRTFWAQQVMALCDELDGVKDNVIGRPGLCRADPGVVQCGPVDRDDCLSPGQVRALRRIYAGPKHLVTGEQLSPGYLPGTEEGFFVGRATGGPAAASFPFVWVWGPQWDWRSFDFGADVDAMRNTLVFAVDATDPDLSAFKARRGKLIVFQGLADPVQVPGAALDYYARVQQVMNGPIDDFYRLFAAPGMAHCGGGGGPNSFGNLWRPADVVLPQDPEHDLLSALQAWVETGRTPETVIATKFVGNRIGGEVERTKPLCAWPRVARYRGGDQKDAASYECAAP